ncbi:MAG: hypothetical protein HC890_16010 [Chloroflexaceae bacterium]|nr:hypothetical protein [Chloroflexaceae bacterium]
MIKSLTQTLKRFRWVRSLAVLLAGILVFVSSACSGAQARTTSSPTLSPAPTVAPKELGPKTAPETRIGTPASKVRSDLPETAVDNPVEGGINVYSDTDPRARNANVGTKTRQLIENAEENYIEQGGSLGGNTQRTVEKKGENLRDLGRNLREGSQVAPEGTPETVYLQSQK